MATKTANPTGLRIVNLGCREGVKERGKERREQGGEEKESVCSTFNG